MRALVVLVLVGCGAAAPPIETNTTTTEPTPRAPFADHGTLVFRSQPPAAQPPFYAELAADGSMTGTRCGATRFTDNGTLEREGVVVARVAAEDGGFVVHGGEGAVLGWNITGDLLTTAGTTRFTTTDGTITPSDTELPTITFDPPTADPTLVLSLFATLLVCDDVGP